MNILDLAIGWIAPAECISCNLEGTSLCQGCKLSEIVPYGDRCFKCNKMSSNSKTCDKCRKSGAPSYCWISTDYEGTAKQLIQLLKFKHMRSAANAISELMTDTLHCNMTAEDMAKLNYLVLPIPTASGRVRQRSFDHSDLIATKFCRQNKMTKGSQLKRLGQTRQVGSKRSVRLAQTRNIYYVQPAKEIIGRNIILIDDVTTTGATLEDAASILRKAGAKRVDALVFAKKL
jgi:ComF family protein